MGRELSFSKTEGWWVGLLKIVIPGPMIYDAGKLSEFILL